MQENVPPADFLWEENGVFTVHFGKDDTEPRECVEVFRQDKRDPHPPGWTAGREPLRVRITRPVQGRSGVRHIIGMVKADDAWVFRPETLKFRLEVGFEHRFRPTLFNGDAITGRRMPETGNMILAPRAVEKVNDPIRPLGSTGVKDGLVLPPAVRGT